ncbi:hypothetical protein C8R48DRAFT_774055 [Suillus tomentosus]|nr:hypothetical protein C8R48DRAFT_774055 [Suillus tomentosus]
MTGARIAHPLLLGLANIRMCTRTKLSSKAFLLMALLPISNYLYSNKCMQGMLEDRLIHQCLSIVLQPLMKAAEVGIMMSDLVGNVQHCFTPLAAYIVDTPEAAMLACICRKTSLFTMASYLQFGDSFQHLSHNRSITLDQLNSITFDPNNLEVYFDAYAEYRLNSNRQWCLTIVGTSELDFRFLILQPITGYCHFTGGISRLKQVTGRGHRDIQCYIVGLISGAAPHRFIIAFHAFMDVQYLVQSPTPNDDLLASIDQALLTFHKHKDIILTSGTRMGAQEAY